MKQMITAEEIMKIVEDIKNIEEIYRISIADLTKICNDVDIPFSGTNSFGSVFLCRAEEFINNINDFMTFLEASTMQLKNSAEVLKELDEDNNCVLSSLYDEFK